MATFITGMRFDRPKQGTPDFVKGKISIKVDELIPFLEHHKNEKGWINIDLLNSKSNVLYLSLNEYKPKDSIKVEGEATNVPE